MPETWRALVAMLFLSFAALAIAYKAFVPKLFDATEFKQMAMFWLVIPLVATAVGSLWAVCIVEIFLVWRLREKIEAPILFFFVWLVLPPQSRALDFIPGVPWLFFVSYQRLLLWLLVLPLLFSGKKSKSTPIGTYPGDWFVVAFVVYQFVLRNTQDTFANSIRNTIDDFTYYFLPYWLCSRYITDKRTMLRALGALTAGCLIASLIGIFEMLRSWMLYVPVTRLLRIGDEYTLYLARGDTGLIRAMAMLAHPLCLGLLTCALFLTIFSFARSAKLTKTSTAAVMGVMLLGVIAPLSRGPWVGLAAAIGLWQLLGSKPLQSIAVFIGASIAAFFVLSVVPGGEKVINLIPWVGKTDSFNVDYREQLLTAASFVFWENPLLGTMDFVANPAFIPLRTGENIVDPVNTYLIMALGSGAIGLFLFTMMYVPATLRGFIAYVQKSMSMETRGLLCTMVAFLIIIATTSPISSTPIIGSFIAGMLEASIGPKKKKQTFGSA